MIYVGVDPGLTGCIAALYPDGRVECWDMPVREIDGVKGATIKREIDAKALGGIICNIAFSGEVSAAVERVGSMAGQGRASIFSLGDSFGSVRALCESMFDRVVYVRPQVWKGALLPVGASKTHARVEACMLYQGAERYLRRKKDHNRGEAILIAHWLKKVVDGAE